MTLSPDELSRALSLRLGRPVQLRLNLNRRTMLSIRPISHPPSVRVSLHKVFLEAPQDVIHAVAGYAAPGGPNADDRLAVRQYINSVEDRLVDHSLHSPPKRVKLGPPRGRIYNLLDRGQAVNERHFKGELTFRIGWGRGSRTGFADRRHVTLGTASVRERIVRIHPVLDNPNVPPWFLDFVIFHELLHLHVPPFRDENGRNAIHSHAFRTIEAAHPHFMNAVKWQKKWIWKLMRAWEKGTALPPKALTDFAPEPATIPSGKPAIPSAAQFDLFGDSHAH